MTETPTPAPLQRAIDIALGHALANEHGWTKEIADADMCAETGGALRRAVASLGAEIVWPSPDSPETPERPSAGDTAPRIDTASATVPVVVLPDGNIAYRMDLWWREIGPDGRDRGNLINLPPGTAPLTPPAAERMDGDR